MRYERSKTALDNVAMFTPASQLNMGRFAAYMRTEPVTLEDNLSLRTRGLLSGIDEGVPDGTGGGSFLGLYEPAPRIPLAVESLWPLDAADGFVTDSFSSPRYLLGRLGQGEVGYDTDVLPGQPAADAALPSTAPGATDASAWNWQSAMDKAPALLRDLFLATSAADYQSKLNQINLERAKRGQPPLSPAEYAPTLNVGVAPQTMKIAGIGAGTFLAVAVASAFGITALSRKRRRR